ncbi:MAG: hypothetical protein IT531_23750 [Burkholderiales bacterium]|nr:hypothetical protein [Burkholderiales bacterium]
MVCELSLPEARITTGGTHARPQASASASLAQRVLELERRNDELESFIHALAHDSGSFLRGISLRTQFLRKRLHSADAESIHLLDVIEDRVLKLSRLVEGLLRLARIGARDLECRAVDMSAMAREVVDELERGDRGRSVSSTIQPGLDAWGDPALIRLALENLLGNAWKYTAHTPAPRIQFGRRADQDEVVYFIADNGIGFAAETASALFSPFARLDSARSFAGTGLGLAAVKRVVERHGGWIRAASEAGCGTTFLFSIGEAARSETAARRAS